MTPISGVVLVVAGAFIVWYWATVLTAGAIALGEVGLVRFIDQLSSTLTDFARRNVVLATGGSLAVAVGGWLTLRASRRRTTQTHATSEPAPRFEPLTGFTFV